MNDLPYIGIIDYGMGNLGSVRNACAFLDLNAGVITSPRQMKECAAVILPGVGGFGGWGWGTRGGGGLGDLCAEIRLVAEKNACFLNKKVIYYKGYDCINSNIFGWILTSIT